MRTGAGRLLIHGGHVLAMRPGQADPGPTDILVEDGRIRELGPDLSADGGETIDARGMIVVPGFVDTHRHVWQTQLRGVAADWTLADYFLHMRSVYSTFYGPEDAYLGNLVGALEGISAGITTLVDHCHIVNSPEHADEAVRGLEESGVRGIFCYGLFANPPVASWPPVLEPSDPGWRFADARRVRLRHFADADGRLVMGVAPSEAEMMPRAALVRELRFAREIGARRISCHVAMGRYDRGRRTVERLAGEGLLADDLLLVHGSALTDRELALIADAGAGLSATPETELQMGMGRPVTARALARGVATSLGIDIVSNYAGDMFAQMRLQLQAERGFQNEARADAPAALGLGVRDVLALATLGGARTLGMDQSIGSLEAGKWADLVLLRTDGIHMHPVHDAAAAVVLYANPSDVDTVLVGGRCLKRGGALVGVDWPRLAERLRCSSERIVTGYRRAVHPD